MNRFEPMGRLDTRDHRIRPVYVCRGCGTAVLDRGIHFQTCLLPSREHLPEYPQLHDDTGGGGDLYTTMPDAAYHQAREELARCEDCDGVVSPRCSSCGHLALNHGALFCNQMVGNEDRRKCDCGQYKPEGVRR